MQLYPTGGSRRLLDQTAGGRSNLSNQRMYSDAIVYMVKSLVASVAAKNSASLAKLPLALWAPRQRAIAPVPVSPPKFDWRPVFAVQKSAN